MNEVMKVVERFYGELYDSDLRPRNNAGRNNLVPEVLIGNKDKVENALKRTKRGKTTGDHEITVDHVKDAGHIS